LDAASTGRPSPELRLLKRERGVATFLRVDTASGARTILKTAPADRLGEGAQHRLEREIELLRGVDPTRLAAPLTAGREGDEAWVVRDYVDGITLSDRIRRGPLSPREAITVGRGVIGALAAAHDRGVLHRDVKPANVIVGTSEPLTDVTLVDFGFARDARLEADAGELTASAAHYVSLEQASCCRRSRSSTSRPVRSHNTSCCCACVATTAS
jgi:serine/threonine protein kinase